MRRKRRRLRMVSTSILFLLLVGTVFYFGKNICLGSGQEPRGPWKLDESYREVGDFSSRNIIVVDRERGRIVLGKNFDERIHPASMTKLMTALIGLEAGQGNKKLVMDQALVDYCHREGLSQSGFQGGDRIRRRDLIYGILLESGGEASLALAEEIAGSQEEFLGLMNQRAQELGMTSTHFSQVTGNTDQDNYSTVEDISLLLDYALGQREFRKILETSSYKASNGHSLSNLLYQKRAILDIDKAYIQGGKTGYTQKAGLCLASYGELGGRTYIVVTAGAPGDGASPQYNLMDTQQVYRILGD